MKNKSFHEVRLSRVCLIVLTAMLFSACGSGSTPDVSVSTDPSLQDEPVVSVLPVLTDAGNVQEFTLLEDHVLRGRFHASSDTAVKPATIRSLPSDGLLTLEPGGQVFVYQPDADFWGRDSFAYQAHDGVDLTVVLNVDPVNDAPVLSPDVPRVAAQGKRFLHELQVNDIDGDALVFTATGLPGWMALDSETGLLSGLPTQADIGFSDEVTIRVTDGGGLFDELTGIRFEVIDVNDPPTLNLLQMPSEMKARESITVSVFPDDPDGDSVVIEVEANDFVSTSVNGSAITLTAADVNEVLDINLVIKATDAAGGVSREIVSLHLLPVTESGRGITLSGSEDGRAVHVVILGDGYAIDQQSLFRKHVDQAIDNMRSDPGIAMHLNALAFHMVSTVSKDSGADDNDEFDIRDTYYDSAYNCGFIQRLVCANTLKMLETAIEEYPSFDQIILLVNDQRYGGSGNSGGSTAITSAYYPDIALHEMGHSLANLADEYVDSQIVETQGYPSFVEGSHPNVTALTDLAQVPWAHWIDPGEPLQHNEGDLGVGLFEGGLYRLTGIYRPTYDSRMRTFDAPFGPVNSERWVLRLYELTDGGIRGFSPVTDTVQMIQGESMDFVVSPLFDADVQRVEWSFDGRTVIPEETPDRLSLAPSAGTHTLSLSVRDISGIIRKPPPHPAVFNWTWTLEVQ